MLLNPVEYFWEMKYGDLLLERHHGMSGLAFGEHSFSAAAVSLFH